MDPKKQECFNRFLYGAGYYSRDENTLGLVTGRGSQQPHFCMSCPKAAACQDAHEKRVRKLRSQETEAFDRRMREAIRRDIPPTLAALAIAKQFGDPFMDTALENFKQGHQDRGAETGPLVQ